LRLNLARTHRIARRLFTTVIAGKRLLRKTRKGLKRYKVFGAKPQKLYLSGKPGLRRFAPQMRPNSEL
jgi:hypothetical protein